MKIALTTTGNDLNAQLDPRFGRAAKFIVVDLETDSFQVVDNAHINASHGAGIQAAEAVINLGAEAVVTGRCGPKAFRVLQSAGVAIYDTQASTVTEALALYRAGKLNRTLSATSQGHRG